MMMMRSSERKQSVATAEPSEDVFLTEEEDGSDVLALDGSAETNKHNQKRRRNVLLGAFIALVVTGVTIGLAVGLTSSSNAESLAPEEESIKTTTPTTTSANAQTIGSATPPPTSASAPPSSNSPSVSPTSFPTTLSPTASPTTSPTSDSINQWLSATVTLDDGVQYEIVDQLYHDTSAFTQGLTFANGRLYESTGGRGDSTVRELHPDTGEVLQNIDMANQYFGEGMTFIEGKLIQITWTLQRGFVYNATNLELLTQFDFDTTTGQGWGITYDGTQLIVSDGGSNLHFWDPNQLGVSQRVVSVTRLDGTPATRLNELEYWRGKVLANVWQTDELLVIDPSTGKVEKEYDFSNLWPVSERPRGTDVFNGISVSQDPNVLYVTGKRWDRMYKIKLLPY